MWILFVICPKSTENRYKRRYLGPQKKFLSYLLKAPCQEFSASWGSVWGEGDVVIVETRCVQVTRAILTAPEAGLGQSEASLQEFH